MRRPLAILLATLIGSQPAVHGAQQGGASSAPPAAGQASPQAAPPKPAAPPSVESLGLSFDRIKRQLDQKPPSTAKTPLKLQFYVEVVAEAPPIPIFAPGELATGPAPGGAPTHRDMMNLVTPLAFKSPSIPIGAIAMVGIQKLLAWEAQKAKEAKAEEARQKKIAAERERQRKIKESIVVSPPKGPGKPAPRP